MKGFDSRKARYLGYWALLTALLPVAVIVLTWVMVSFFYKSDHAFAEVFGSGDLIPVGALLLLGLWLEIQFDTGQEDLGHFVALSEPTMLFAGVISLLFYGLGKSFAIHEITAAASDATKQGDLFKLGGLSCVFMAYALIHTLSTKMTIVSARRLRSSKEASSL